MNKNDLKPIIMDFFTNMMNEWFADKPLWKSLGNAFINANINKYDNIIDMFADEHGYIDIEGILDSIGDTMEESFQIDLENYSPLLPKRVLLITKEDIKNLIASLHHYNDEKQIQLGTSC